MTELTSPLTIPQHRDTATTRIHAPWVWAARALWVLLLIPIIIAAIPIVGTYYGKLVRMEPAGIYSPDEWGASELDVNTLPEAVRASGISPELIAGFVFATDVAGLVVSCAAGLLIFWRKSDEWVGLMASFALITLGLTGVSQTLADSSVPAFLVLPINLIVNFSWPLFMTLPALFPDGRFVPRFMRIFPVVIFGLFSVMFILYPTGSPPDSVALLVMILAGASIASAVYRYLRHSSPLQKQQTKWFVFGLALWISTSVLGAVIAAIFAPTGPDLLAFRLAGQVLGLSFYLIPIGLAFGLLRYRLWDVDFIINRTVVLGIMALLFVAIAGVSLFAISQLAANLPGGPLVGVAIGAAIFGVAFGPVHRECRTFVDRLYGIKLDYVKAVKSYEGSHREVRRTGGTKSSFGSYSDLKLLGRGGMGEVYRAQHPTLNRAVAIKILPPSTQSDDEAHKRFLREAQTVARLKHSNIVTLHDVGDQDGQPYMVMEYIDGPDLSALIKQRGKLPLNEAVPLLQDIAAALDYAHGQGVVHRDVKPSNVMVEHVTGSGTARTQRAVLMDFGIAKSYAATSKLTSTGMIGTLDYISPEQIQGAAEVDARADIYSVGVMAYQMLAGDLPFKHNNPGAMVMAHINQPAPDLRDSVPDLPENAAIAVMQAMSKKPQERFNTVGEMLAAMTT